MCRPDMSRHACVWCPTRPTRPTCPTGLIEGPMFLKDPEILKLQLSRAEVWGEAACKEA